MPETIQITGLEPSMARLVRGHFEGWLRTAAGPAREAHLRELWDTALRLPAEQFLVRPGKHFRGRLSETAWCLAGGAPDALPCELPLLVEILHAGSLIVDDVQDDSDRRRGRPSLHRVVGVPLAINTGNLFYCWALELIASLGLTPEIELGMYRATAQAMLQSHQGQALDLSVCVLDLAPERVRSVVETSTELKAGALMGLAATLGALGAGCAPERRQVLESMGRCLGLGLQMLDDLSGVLNPARKHKALEDLALSRPTWSWVWLAERLSPAEFASLQGAARGARETGAWSPVIERMAAELDGWTRPIVRAHLDRGLAGTRREFGADLNREPAFHALENEVERLMTSYV